MFLVYFIVYANEESNAIKLKQLPMSYSFTNTRRDVH